MRAGDTVIIHGDTYYDGRRGSVHLVYPETGTVMVVLTPTLTLPFAGSEVTRTYQCVYPDKSQFDELPEGWDEWQSAADCTHEYCQEVDGYRRSYRPDPLTKDDHEAIAADRELVLNEYHGVYP